MKVDRHIQACEWDDMCYLHDVEEVTTEQLIDFAAFTFEGEELRKVIYTVCELEGEYDGT